MNLQYSEKRDFIRMKINTPAEVHVEQDGTVTQGVCNDLSGSGMLLTVKDSLPVEIELLVTVGSDQDKGPSLRARCTIARSQQAADNQCLLGLEMQEIIDEHDLQVA